MSITRPKIATKNLKQIFFCPEESNFYSNCIEKFVFSNCNYSDSIVEFGSGDGSPVINLLLKNKFEGVIHGFELNPTAWQAAISAINEYNLHEQYIINNSCLFESDQPQANYLIANPPYIPAPDNDIYMPLLSGGKDGSEITNKLLALDYENVVVLVSSFSNPIGTIEQALAQGYSISDFVILPLKFGYYSSEPKVKRHIEELRSNNMAFYSGEYYGLAGILFQKQGSAVDLSEELIQMLTSFSQSLFIK
ncbi:SAM-dependent methyltransferase [Nostoc sp. CMAA1605]|uniref:SAM-dependent methyltransferase n=1 Tax=Nostoc sp. CMAA1605 TaxID=2055159 RepID=UPI001F3BB2D0|nr:SAM-dependent methyltransferase [Nostoc sp. CMAA1605]MCF4968202.1 SAM-dependent methyltransferase [Nostoc sp. CMAA1605]